VEWEAQAVVLDARPYGEGGALVSVLTEAHGPYRALARGGGGRAQASLWQQGNVVEARWVARLADQLGSVSAELVHSPAAGAMDDPMAMAMLASLCAVAEGALPEREPHQGVFRGLLALLEALPSSAEALPALVRWEAIVLAELGYGLDLGSCAVTGAATDLAFVSPKTGRAVSRAAAGVWEQRLLVLPPFLAGAADSGPADWRDGLKLTGHFLARDAFGQQHRPVPTARQMLYDRVLGLLAESV
jgi:DNA repair protein RecO (recombination protein O)